MSCNCKKKADLEDAYGVPQEENLIEKTTRMLMKIFMFFLLVLIGIVVTPVMIAIIIYKASFTNDMTITLPKFMGKYMK